MDWQYTYLPGHGPDFQPIFSVIAKCTYAISPGRLVLCETQLPLVENDEFVDSQNPFYSDCIAESDLVAYKPTTDVIVTGKACAPRGKQAYSLECEAVVGPLKKTVRVYGERSVERKIVRGIYLSDPKPFSMMDLGYARAFGGLAKSRSGALFPFFPNPIGRGFSINGGFDDVTELSVPNLEDPSSPITADALIVDKYEEWAQAAKAASFGWTRRNFYPRYTYCGVPPLFLDGTRREAGAVDKKMPRMDPRFHQGASEGLYGAKLRGDENVMLKYFDQDYTQLQFTLPGEKPFIVADIGMGPTALTPELQTVIIDMNCKILSLVWCGSCSIESFEAIEKIEVKVR